MSRMERAREGVRLDPPAVESILRTTQAQHVARPWMEVEGFTVQVTSPRERVRLRHEDRESIIPDLDAVNARRLAVCLLFAAAYIETEPPSAEEVLGEVELILGTPAAPADRLDEAMWTISEWRRER